MAHFVSRFATLDPIVYSRLDFPGDGGIFLGFDGI